MKLAGFRVTASILLMRKGDLMEIKLIIQVSCLRTGTALEFLFFILKVVFFLLYPHFHVWYLSSDKNKNYDVTLFNFIFGGPDKLNNDFPKISWAKAWNLYILPYKEKRSLQVWLTSGSWDGERLLHYPGGT